ncbi:MULTISPECIES: hypothetical protein [unclassified Streptomyces]|uniref:hypothetical protein n=1 Tax=unclassified Streptomyces TaxID=2593676 RepID=UPI002476A39C|nr:MULTISPECIES: hypothetical protein [unclassified Streptomyces]MDH6454388.1 hypothetical protein [Streptomyces sp. SAI-119]MDH6495053.1 hypothetical protein [Streptomyces sp. SAI-149]
MTDHTHHVRLLRDLADSLEAQSTPADAPFTPHPDTQAIISTRHNSRSQLNYAVPEALQLQRRIRRYNADHGTPHGDIVATALDIWLRAKGYPPDLPPLKTEEQ